MVHCILGRFRPLAREGPLGVQWRVARTRLCVVAPGPEGRSQPHTFKMPRPRPSSLGPQLGRKILSLSPAPVPENRWVTPPPALGHITDVGRGASTPPSAAWSGLSTVPACALQGLRSLPDDVAADQAGEGQPVPRAPALWSLPTLHSRHFQLVLVTSSEGCHATSLQRCCLPELASRGRQVTLPAAGTQGTTLV